MADSQIENIENSAREIVTKVMLEALDTLDLKADGAEDSWRGIASSEKCNKRKSRSASIQEMRECDEKIKNNLYCEIKKAAIDVPDRSLLDGSAFVSEYLRTHENTNFFNVDQKTNEQIHKIVQGLQRMQIGDSLLIQPDENITILEEDVKPAIQEINDIDKKLQISELPLSVSQGDVRYGINQELTNAPISKFEYELEESSSIVLNGKEVDIGKINVEDFKEVEETEQAQQRVQENQQDIAKLRSTCFLHRIIKDLKDVTTNQENVLKVPSSISAISQECIAAWEENAEQFIRTIEDLNDEDKDDEEVKESEEEEEEEEEPEMERSTDTPEVIKESPIFLEYDAPAGCIVEIEIEELDSTPESPPPTFSSVSPRPPLAPALPPSSSTSGQCLGVKKKTIYLQQLETKMKKSGTKDKKSIGGKIRQFFRKTFKRETKCL